MGKATKSRHLAYKLQREAAVSVGAPQQKADWAAEQEKTVAGFMQNQADEARDALVRYLSKNKRKLERKRASIMMKKKAKRKAIKAQKKVLKQKAKKEKKKLVKKAVKAAKKKVVKMKKKAAKKKAKKAAKKLKAKAKKAKKAVKKKAAKKKAKAAKKKAKPAPHVYGHSHVLKFANSQP